MVTEADVKEAVKRFLMGYARFEPVYGETENELFFDDEKGHYELMRHGWKGHERIHGSVVHVDVRDGKAWIQYDGTEYGAANELLGLGFPRDHIVLAFKHPDTRKLTDFAVA